MKFLIIKFYWSEAGFITIEWNRDKKALNEDISNLDDTKIMYTSDLWFIRNYGVFFHNTSVCIIVFWK